MFCALLESWKPQNSEHCVCKTDISTVYKKLNSCHRILSPHRTSPTGVHEKCSQTKLNNRQFKWREFELFQPFSLRFPILILAVESLYWSEVINERDYVSGLYCIPGFHKYPGKSAMQAGMGIFCGKRKDVTNDDRFTKCCQLTFLT